MDYIIEYDILVAGTSNGLTIPANFRIGIVPSTIIPDSSGVNDFLMQSQLCTYEPASPSVIIPNDDFPDLEDVSSVGVDKAELDGVDNYYTVLGNKVKPVLDAVYGASNVVLVP